jgi:hypothetical protein
MVFGFDFEKIWALSSKTRYFGVNHIMKNHQPLHNFGFWYYLINKLFVTNFPNFNPKKTKFVTVAAFSVCLFFTSMLKHHRN